MNDYRPLATDAHEPLLAAVLAAHERHLLFLPATAGGPTTVIVGVSGGADSVALFHLLCQLRQPLGLDLHVAHLDHALRPESAQDAAFVAQLAQAWGLPYHQQRLLPGTLTDQAGGLENAGRRARYTFFAQVAINVTPPAQVPCVALAHHADDQAETVLLHLVRGSGLRGLGGMRWVQPLALAALSDDPTQAQVTLRLVRPLLQVRKLELVRYLQAHQIPWREDASNQSQEFARNRLRHEVLPLLATLNPGIVETLGRTARTLAAEDDRISPLDQQTFTDLWLERRPGADTAPRERIVLDLAGLRQQDPATQRGVLRLALAQLTPHLSDYTFEQGEQLRASISQPICTRGPHPLYGEIAWSVAGPTRTQPARLSLHHQAALPFWPAHPYVEEAWRRQCDPWPLPVVTQLHLTHGWELRITPVARAELPADWRHPDHPWRVYLAADQAGTMVLTTPQPGMAFAPLGLNGRHKQLGDFFTDHKIPPTLRPGWPLISDKQSNEILWVCGLAIAHRVRLTEQTERVVELVWQQSGLAPSISKVSIGDE